MYRSDCRKFRGDVPCELNKLHGITCDNCDYYKPTLERILIIKLGAIGDVIRTTPILRVLKKKYPEAEIWWLTHHPEVVPVNDGYVDNVLTFKLEDILQIQATEFNAVYNLDKDREACALTKLINAIDKYGFFLGGGKPEYYPEAEHKFLTGIDDNLSKANKKSYQKEIFEICGFEFQGEEYIIDRNSGKARWNLRHSEGKFIIGLNTGCGWRWKTRLWKVEYWIELAEKLRSAGHEVVILGGEQEHETNKAIVKRSGALYFGYFPFKDFVNLVDACHLIVTPVTGAMHLAIGLGKKVVAFNNIFNPFETESYGRLTIVQPPKPCKCYFQSKCTNDGYFCMDTLKPNKVFSIIKEILNES